MVTTHPTTSCCRLQQMIPRTATASHITRSRPLHCQRHISISRSCRSHSTSESLTAVSAICPVAVCRMPRVDHRSLFPAPHLLTSSDRSSPSSHSSATLRPPDRGCPVSSGAGLVGPTATGAPPHQTGPSWVVARLTEGFAEIGHLFAVVVVVVVAAAAMPPRGLLAHSHWP